ncbi:DUF3253 domain-containing protein [Cyclobacterium qasimii]|uniref:Uncharacterized protein n=1 Tax=Cyclobacterium qasimii TaxID=1350429 RepID=A0A512C7U4_9BACT|nr:DUF3253 domain-containing protein [Cyclobacterium qasimii]GEO20286.1 hypothetical protein CQA01_08200 [Cyclobacterium qasimii]
MNYLDKGILVLATMEMAKRKKEIAFSPIDVVKWIYPNDWESFLEDENEAVAWLYENGCITLENEGKVIDIMTVGGPNKIKLY